jgi:hypothetical protein
MKITPSDYVNLLRAKIDILKLKADDHDWQCYVPKKVKEELEYALEKVNIMLECSSVEVE